MPRKTRVHVDQEMIDGVRRGDGRAFKRLFQACKNYAYRHAGGLSYDEIEDVVAEALGELETIAVISNPASTPEEIGIHLARSLDKHLQRTKRHKKRFVSIDTLTQSPLVQDLFGQEMQSFLKGLTREAMRLLSDQDHDLLLHRFELYHLGLKPRSDIRRVYPSKWARLKASQRAAKHFGDILVGLLQASLETVDDADRRTILHWLQGHPQCGRAIEIILRALKGEG